MLRNLMKKNAALLSIRGKFSYRQDRIGIVSAKRMNQRAYQGNSVNVGGNFRYFHLSKISFQSEEIYRKLYTRFDTYGDGKIGVDEFVTRSRDLGLHVTEQEIEILYSEFEFKTKGEMDFEEFTKFMEKMKDAKPTLLETGDDDDDPTSSAAQSYNVNATDGHEYGASRTPLDAPIGSLREKWRVLPHFLKLRGLMKQHIDSFDHFVSVEMKQIVQVSLIYTYIHLICIVFFDDVNNK